MYQIIGSIDIFGYHRKSAAVKKVDRDHAQAVSPEP